MKDSDIKAVAEVLEKWNPLGEYADSIADLEGYKTEAIDIVSMLSFSAGKISTAMAIGEVLSEAFELPLDTAAVQAAANEIDGILGTKR
ncbi:hypothetical protein [Pseudomonas paeninsulae]|uniref:hypothetical protein n=1 Tax=Pseudomonas paeninsulae TaxID=3110772 RepID=UPI002D794BD7|nr:hypothetical protein [Pseudomonas sp. IT1137]